MHDKKDHFEQEPIVFEYGKAKLSIPVGKPRIWAWILMPLITVVSGVHFELELHDCQATEKYLLQQLEASKGLQSISLSPQWGENALPETLEQRLNRMRPRSPLTQLNEDSRFEAKGHKRPQRSPR